MEKLSTDLGVVQETLLLPLMARAKDATSKHPILNDKKALALSQQIDTDFDKYYKYMKKTGMIGLCERALIMDNKVKQFMQQHPKGKILNIGVGLETAYYRLNQPKYEWYDLDLPDAMELRAELLPIPNEYVTYIYKSMFDFSWMYDIGDIDDGLLITVPGVFMYFDEGKVSAFFRTIASRLTGAHIVFDVVSNMGGFFIGRQVQMAGMKNATMDWGVMQPKDIEKWSNHIKFVEAIPYFKNTKNYDINILLKALLSTNQYFDISQVFHFQFV
ncbi:MAG: class I SAM-dependent methyltransferase [Chitinophagales bacterium]|nr:class I SAM-dependent methyltransferase [Chitinophagales bacterium]